MVIGLRGVQFGLYAYEWLTKSDDREAGVRFNLLIMSIITGWIGRPDVLLPINHNHYNFPLFENSFW